MSVAAPGTTVVADDARTVREGLCHTALPYGHVRVRSGEIAIGVESLPRVSRFQRSLYELAVVAAGVQPDNVLVVRVTEARIEVDAIDVDDARWPVRTQRVALAELHRLLRQDGRHHTELSTDRES
jgi:hypothetical protein